MHEEPKKEVNTERSSRRLFLVICAVLVLLVAVFLILRPKATAATPAGTRQRPYESAAPH